MIEKNVIPNEVNTYRPLPFFPRLKNNIINYFHNKVSHFRFPWKKLIILGLIVMIGFGIYLVVLINQVDIPIRASYDKTGFLEATEYIKSKGNETVMENTNYRLSFNNRDTTFILLDKTTNIEWRSNPNTTSSQFLDILNIWYAGSLGAATKMSTYQDAVKYNDYLIRLMDNSIEVLYEVGGKKGVDESDFPKIITDERMQEKILSKLEEGSTPYQRITKQFYVLGDIEGVKVWSLKDGIQTSLLNTLYKIFYEDCKYTTEDLKTDLAAYGIVYEDKYSYIEVAIKYTLTNEGMDVVVINDSIFEKEKFPLVSIEILPFFGAGTTLDTGYSIIPDGSGVLIDFNNNRSFNVPYNQRIYGKDQAVIRPEIKIPSETINLPVYGMKRNNSGFIAILKEGSEMSSIISKVSSTDRPYNQTYYQFYLRESETFQFEALNQSPTIVETTDWYSTSDFNLKIQFVHEDEGGYNGMAKLFQEYLMNENILSKKDINTNVALDLTLLGGYVVKENFLGLPYESIKSLTNMEQVKTIINELKAQNIQDINLIYKGWSNDGLKPTYMGKIIFNNATGSEKDLKSLNEYLDLMKVNFYPEVSLNRAYTDKLINNDDIVRNIFGKYVKNYGYNEATLYQDLSTSEYYTLKPSTFSHTLKSLNEKFTKNKISNIGFNDYGNQVYGSYDKKDNYFKTDYVEYFNQSNLKYLTDFQSVLFRNPAMFALPYTSKATDLPLYGTNYQIVSYSIPFLQLVFSGYLDYSSKSLNLDDEYSFQFLKMKSIETASNISFTWSYESTINLVDTEYNYYYSTYYKNWFDKAVDLYKELNSLKVYESSLLSHYCLNNDASVTKTIYNNGLEIVFNYGISDYNYQGMMIPPNSYRIVKEAI